MTSDPLSLQEIQQANLSALVEIDRICRENRLRYFLAYGTLIGAVRHHGFIPWDDDVDIFMPRKDYDALHKILGDGIVNGFKLCTRANTKHYPYYIPRFCNMRYRYETEQKEPIFDIGAFVDIYPLDNYCSDMEHGRKLVRRIRRMNATYMLYNKGAIGKNGLVRAASSVASILLHLAEGKKLPERINGRIDRFLLANTSDQDTYVGVPFQRSMMRFCPNCMEIIWLCRRRKSGRRHITTACTFGMGRSRITRSEELNRRGFETY